MESSYRSRLRVSDSPFEVKIEQMSTMNVQLSSSMAVELLAEEEQFDSIRDEWDELLDDSGQCVFFLRWAWNRLWWRMYAPRQSRLSLIACRDERGRLAGLAPFYWRRRAGIPHLREVLFLGTGIGIKTSEYLDIITRRGYERPVAHAIAAFLRQRDDWDRLCLWGIPSASTALPYLHDALGARTCVAVCDRYPYVDTRFDWAAVKTGTRRSVGVNIDRLIRQLFKRYTCEFRRVGRLEELDRAMDDFVRLHQARWRAQGQSGSFASVCLERFMRETMRSSFEDGRLRFWVLNLNGQCAAALVAFVDHGIAHYFQGGFDPTKSGLGKLMLALCIQDCIQTEEIDQFDFMGGGATYKEDWTKTAKEGIELELLRPGVRSEVYLAKVRVRRTLAKLYHALLSESQRRRIRGHIRNFRVGFGSGIDLS